MLFNRLILYRMLTKDSCDAAALIASFLHMLATLSCALGIFLKPLVWISLERWSPRGHSHRGHIHMRWRELPSVRCCLFALSQLAVRNRMLSARFFWYSSLFPYYRLIPEHIPPTHTHILTYLSFSCTHRHILKTPHRTCDCCKTILYLDERISARFWFSPFLSWIQIIKAWVKKRQKTQRSFPLQLLGVIPLTLDWAILSH